MNKNIRNRMLWMIGILLVILGIFIVIYAVVNHRDRDTLKEPGTDHLQTESETWTIETNMGQSEMNMPQSEKDTRQSEMNMRQKETVFPQGEAVLPQMESDIREAETAIGELDIDSGFTNADSESAVESQPVRIVLDPGHDDSCSRNHPELGFNEQDLNLKIALACREELETYDGVEVFLTREDGSCPDNGIGSDDVTGRTAYAESVDADLFVSLHNNATGLGYPSAANGAEVYISVYSPFTEQSRKLGEAILGELTAQVDLADRGVLTRIKPEKGYYDDGQIKDWYYLISTSVERGFPGIIVEHAFMDNARDNALLKDDEQLKAMGIADATGIAKYYGLVKK